MIQNTESDQNDNSSQINHEEIENGLKREQLIAQFCEVVGKADIDEAVSLLKACDWNLQNATAVYFEHYEFLNSPWNPAVDSISNHQIDSSQFPVSSTVTETSTSSLFSSWILDNVKQLGFTVFSLSQKIYSLFRLFCNSLSYATSALPVTDFNVYFREKFGEPSPEFFTQSFVEACQRASQGRKVLLTYIHQASSEHASSIPRNVFQNSTMLELIQKNQVIVWASHSDDLEARVLIRRRLVPCTSLPHLAFVIFPKMQASDIPVSTLLEQTSSPFEFLWAIIGFQEGNVTNAESAISLLQSGLEKTNQFSQLDQRRELSIEEGRRLREEQDKAYENARQKDLQRQAEKESLEKEQKIKEQKLKQQLEQAQNEQELNKQSLEAQRKVSAKQFFVWHKNHESDSGQQVMIRVRCGNTASFERSFYTAETTVSNLFDWVDTIAYLFEPCVSEQIKESRIKSVCETTLSLEEIKAWCGSVYGTIESTDIPKFYSLVIPLRPDVQLKRTADDEMYLKTLQQLELNSNTIFLLRPC